MLTARFRAAVYGLALAATLGIGVGMYAFLWTGGLPPALRVPVAAYAAMLAMLALQFRRYPGARVFAFDHGGSIRAAVLGMGGYSVVYLAQDTKLERKVAVKEYLPGTLAATFAAAAAYASLMIADFRGFREFGALAGVATQ